MNLIQVGKDVLVGYEKLVLIAGPCVIEGDESCANLAVSLKLIAKDAGVDLIFKASFDKANRTEGDSFRGVGIVEGLRILEQIRQILGIATLTDVHDPAQAHEAAYRVDVVQIPALLCMQTDLLRAAGAACGRSGSAVNIKKGQFASPTAMHGAANKVIAGAHDAGVNRPGIMLTERGTVFGYDDQVADMRSLVAMRRFEWPIVFDATHSQAKRGSDLGYIAPLARAAVATGVDAVYMEVGRSGQCDGDRSIELDDLPQLLNELVAINKIVK